MRPDQSTPRRALLLAALAAPALARPAAARLVPGDTPLHGPPAAPGVLLWLHGSYREGGPADPPELAHRLTEAGWDLYRLIRPSMAEGDPLAPAAEELRDTMAAMRQRGYRQLAMIGESRGAFGALLALSEPGLADAALFVAPAAHGPRPERRPQALADFREAMARVAPGALRRAGLVQFLDDPYDPDPPARRDAFLAAMRGAGISALSLFHPAQPVGHGGLNDPTFDARFGGCLGGFLDLRRPAPEACTDALGAVHAAG